MVYQSHYEKLRASVSQLIRENSVWENKTIVYTYDAGGNILVRKDYEYTTGSPGTAKKEISYTYGDANWKDKLTSYDGQSITYDAIGNPLNYRANIKMT